MSTKTEHHDGDRVMLSDVAVATVLPPPLWDAAVLYECEPSNIRGTFNYVYGNGGPITRATINSLRAVLGGCIYRKHWHVETRCNWLKAGEVQHRRADWHRDNVPERGYFMSLGVGPTGVYRGGEEGTLHPGLIYEFDRHTLHRCPPAPNPGWRFFFRAVLHHEPIAPRTARLIR